MRPTTSAALAAFALGFALCPHAIAQDQVRIFEEAPSIEELRAILVPDSGPGMSRKIEIPRQDSTAVPGVVAPSSALGAAPPPAPVQAGKADSAATAGTAASMPKGSVLKPAALPVPKP